MKGKENPKRYEFYSEGAIYRQQQVQDARWRLVTTRIKISLTTNLTLKVTPRSRRQLRKLKFYVTVFLLMIKINQSTQEKSLRYYEKKKKKNSYLSFDIESYCTPNKHLTNGLHTCLANGRPLLLLDTGPMNFHFRCNEHLSTTLDLS